MNEFWIVTDDGTIESNTRGLVGHLKNCEGMPRRLIAHSPQLHELLRQIVAMDSDAHPGLASWMMARQRLHEKAQTLLELVQ